MFLGPVFAFFTEPYTCGLETWQPHHLYVEQRTMEQKEESNTHTAMQELKGLMNKKDELEKEIEMLVGSLNAPGMPGIEGGLVDKDGFPLEDVALIISVREQRGRLARTWWCW